MNQHTTVLLTKMLSLLKDFQQKQLSLRRLVEGLEGAHNAIEEELPKAFDSSWYDHWGALEMVLALTVEGFSTEQQHESTIRDAVSALHRLIGALLSITPNVEQLR